MTVSIYRPSAILLVGAIVGSLLSLGPSVTATADGSPSFTRKLHLQPFLLLKTRGGGAASRVMAKGEAETASNTVSEPLTQRASLTEKDDPLVKDIELLSSILAETVKRGNPRIHELYTQFRQYGLAR